MICVVCWRHISEFYSFQQLVLQAQADLQAQLADVKQIVSDVLEVKVEDEVAPIQLPPIEVVEASTTITALCEEDLKNEQEYNSDDGILPYDVLDDDNPFTSDDDEKPLIEHVIKAKNKRKCTKKTEDSNEKEKSLPSKRQRKPKNANKEEKIPKEAKARRKRKVKNNSTEKDENHDGIEFKEENSHDGSSNDKKSVKEKTMECDAFIAQWKQELECVCCSTTVANFTLLRKHFRTEHPEEKCYVICCQRKFFHRFHIVEHIRLHIDPDVFKCDKCGRCSTNSRNLAKHKREMHTEEGKLRPFECDVCHKKFSNKTILRTHMEVHESGRDHICSECGKGFPSENRRKIHERMVHQADRICDQCGKTIHGVYALKMHLLEHAGIEKPKWPCDQCNAQLNSHSSLKRHKLITHHDGSTVYICSECGKIFTSENALRSHKRIVHLIQRKFKCNICEKAFKFPKILREHMASHTGVDLYQCPHCPKTFKVSANMHHHRKKAHPKEWAEARVNKPVSNKVDISLVSNEIII